MPQFLKVLLAAASSVPRFLKVLLAAASSVPRFLSPGSPLVSIRIDVDIEYIDSIVATAINIQYIFNICNIWRVPMCHSTVIMRVLFTI